MKKITLCKLKLRSTFEQYVFTNVCHTDRVIGAYDLLTSYPSNTRLVAELVAGVKGIGMLMVRAFQQLLVRACPYTSTYTNFSTDELSQARLAYRIERLMNTVVYFFYF